MNKVTGFIKKVFGLLRRERNRQEVSRFAEFLKAVEKKDPVYPLVREAVDLCDESLDNINLRAVLVDRMGMLEKSSGELKAYAELDEDEVEYLKKMQTRCSAVARDIGISKQQMMGFSNAVVHLAAMEEQAPGAVGEIKDAENRQRMYGSDMYLLRDEKSELEHERERLMFLIGFLYRFTKVIVGVFVAASVIAVLAHIFAGADILLVITVMLIVVVVLTVLLYRLRKKLSADLKANNKKQNRAVSLINTKTVAYSQYTGLLKYYYTKYKVENADALQKNLTEYERYKLLTKRYDALKSIMKQSEDELLNFLKLKDIPITTTTEHFSTNTDPDERRKKHGQIAADIYTVEHSIQSIDTRQEEIFFRLTHLAGGKAGSFVSAIMTAYNNEAAKEQALGVINRNAEESRDANGRMREEIA